MGKQLFIQKKDMFKDASDTNLVAADLGAGQIAIGYATDDGLTTIYASDQASDLDNDTPFQVIWKKSNTTDIIEATPNLTLGEFTNSYVIQAATGTKQQTEISDISDCIPTAQEKGDTYLLKIIKTTPGTANLDKWNFEVTHEGTDLSDTTIVDAFVSDINLMSDTMGIYAVDGTADLQLKATYASDHFRVSCDELLSAATIDYTSDAVPANGLAAQIKDLETKMKSHGEGITNTIWFPKDYTSEVNTAAAYDLGVHEFTLKQPAKHGMNAVNDSKYTLFIANTSDSNAASDVNTVLTGLWDSKNNL